MGNILTEYICKKCGKKLMQEYADGGLDILAVDGLSYWNCEKEKGKFFYKCSCGKTDSMKLKNGVLSFRPVKFF